MSRITITGHSDDIICVSGDISEEFERYSGVDTDEAYVAVSTGTLLSVLYDNNGIWRFYVVRKGSANIGKVEGDIEAGTNDSVAIDSDDPIQWVAIVTDGLALRRKSE